MNIPILAFNKGEMSPKIDCRADIDSYSSGCRRLENMIPSKYGCAERRPGTEYIDTATGTLNILVPFIYSSEIAYVLEFSDQLIRVFYDGTVLLNGASEVTVSTDYLEADLRELQFYQIADTMWIVHPDYPPAKVTRTSAYVFAINDIVFDKGPFLTRNDLIDPNVTDTAMMVCDVTDYDDTGTMTCFKNYILTLDSAPTGTWSVGDTLTGASSLVTCEIVTVTSTTVYVVTEPSGEFTDGEVISNGTYSRDCAANYPTVEYNTIDYFEAGHIGALFQLTHPKGTLNVSGSRTSTGYIGDTTGQELTGDYTFKVVSGAGQINLEKSDNDFSGHTTSDLDSYDANYILVTHLHKRGSYKPPTATEPLEGWNYRIRVKTYTSGTIKASLVANTNTVSGKLTTTNTGVIKYPINIKGKFRYTTHGNWDGTFIIERNENGGGWEPFRTTVSAIVSGMGTRNVQESLIEESDNVQFRMNVPIHTSGTIYADITSEENIQSGIVRVTAINHDYEAAIEVVSDLASTESTKRWSEGAWSGVRGYPSSVTFYKGRCVYGAMTDVAGQVTGE
jgi:hypothetical protein